MIRTIISWAGSCIDPDGISCPIMLILSILDKCFHFFFISVQIIDCGYLSERHHQGVSIENTHFLLYVTYV